MQHAHSRRPFRTSNRYSCFSQLRPSLRTTMQEPTAEEPGSSQDDNGISSDRLLHKTKRFTLRIWQKNLRFRLFNVNASPYQRKASARLAASGLESEEHAGVVFRCVTCKEVLPTAVALRDHSKTHSSRKIYTCNECGRKFAFRETLARHMETHQGKPGTEQTCTFMGPLES